MGEQAGHSMSQLPSSLYMSKFFVPDRKQDQTDFKQKIPAPLLS